MRCGYPLKYFKEGESKSYVFPASYESGLDYIEDYNDKYDDNKSFCELIGRFVLDACYDNNEEYAWKIVRVLAKKLKVDKYLRKKPLTDEQWLKLSLKKHKEWCKKNKGWLKKLGFKYGY